MADRRRHILVTGTAQPGAFTAPQQVFKPPRPSVDRAKHGHLLQQQLAKLHAELDERSREMAGALGASANQAEPAGGTAGAGIPAPDGFALEFESFPGFDLVVAGLESITRGIRLLSYRQVHDKTFATVFVPEGEVGFFAEKIEQFLTEDTRGGKPKHAPLISSIAAIRLAIAESFWTDAPRLLPPREERTWWEVWLRGTGADTLQKFRAAAQAAGLRVGAEVLSFPERTVVLAEGSLDQFAQSLPFLDMLAELRRARDLCSFYIRLSPDEQFGWAKDLLARIQTPHADSPAVCVLDTGVNAGHPLLETVIDASDVHAYDPAWGTHDELGHGTEMAGIAAFGGDLTGLLSGNGPLELTHRLESAKILPPPGQANDRKLFGAVMAGALFRAEAAAPKRKRVFALATTTIDADDGQPTSWSAEIDRLAAGVGDGQRRLFFIAAGNIRDESAGLGYRHRNERIGIEDPAQSWNALTVGAYTDLVVHDELQDGWRCIATPGQLAPTSRTSCSWPRQWPLKPDIVMEGGNLTISLDGTRTEAPLALSLLTTAHDFRKRLFTWLADTSAATAAAARLGAMVRAQYPDLWDETIRALLVDSAEWTSPMRKELDAANDTQAIERLLRCFGFGVPDLERACWSAGNALTLIVQDQLQPFDGNASKEMHLHKLPWPSQALRALGSTEVELRVSLSYFIEPSPSRISKRRHRYASHGLRFAVQRPAETRLALEKRVNAAARDENEEVATGDPDGWLLKPNLRGKGSLHHDRWRGTAADLAAREHVAIYPVIGWWRERLALKRSKSTARYSLVVTIRTPQTDVDIYTPVANILRVPVTIGG